MCDRQNAGTAKNEALEVLESAVPSAVRSAFGRVRTSSTLCHFKVPESAVPSAVRLGVRCAQTTGTLRTFKVPTVELLAQRAARASGPAIGMSPPW